jgi:hypothetical protein
MLSAKRLFTYFVTTEHSRPNALPATAYWSFTAAWVVRVHRPIGNPAASIWEFSSV